MPTYLRFEPLCTEIDGRFRSVAPTARWIGDPMTALVSKPMPSDRLLLRGAEGLRRCGGYATLRTPDPASFRAELTDVIAPGVALQVFTATEHDGVRGAAEIAATPREVVSITLVVNGLLRLWDGDEQIDLEPGSLNLRVASQPHRWRFVGPTTIIRSYLPTSSVPGPLLASDLPRGPLPKTRLVTSYIALMQTLAGSSSSLTTIEADYLWRGFANLEVAVIAEAAGEVGPEPSALRTRIADYIDGHLGDPTLGPESIATVLGISVRSVHRAFNDREVSVHRYIREQRLSQVEAALRQEIRISRTSVLSRRFGFTGPDQLARAFRARFGMTIHDYVESLPTRVPGPDQRGAAPQR